MLVVVIVTLLASCGIDPRTDRPSDPQPLRIGSLLPHSGDQASAGASLIAATRLAIDDINAAGGVFGRAVSYRSQDSTSRNDTALEAADALLDWGADIVIGTYGSSMAGAVVEPITSRGVLMVSGSNTSPSLTGISPLYFRTAPSDSLEAASLADLLATDGKTSVGLIWQDDAWGAAFREAMVANLDAAGVQIVAAEPFDVDDVDYTAQIRAIVKAQPDAVVLLSYATYTASMIDQLVGEEKFPSSDIYFSSSTLGDYSGRLSDPGYLEGVQAFQPGADATTQRKFERRLRRIDPTLTSFAYSASTYDATIVAALGAVAAESTDGVEIAERLREVSGGSGDGQKCTSFRECKALLEEHRPIDYDGLTGGIAFDVKNDETETKYVLHVFGRDGTYSVK